MTSPLIQDQKPSGCAAHWRNAWEISSSSSRVANPLLTAWSAKSLSITRTAHISPQTVRPSCISVWAVVLAVASMSVESGLQLPMTARYRPASASPPLAEATWW